MAAGLWYGYSLLSQDLRDRLAAQERRLQEARQTLAAAEAARGRLSVELEEARARLRYMETRYERDVPSGAARRLHDLVVRMLDQGVPADRLAFLIEASEAAPQCAETPETRQLPVALPVTLPGGVVPAEAVTFADRRITVTAEGVIATDEQGRLEAWFDPAEPVQVRFSRLGGETAVVDGLLPLHHSMVVDGAEYRFTVTAGRPGLIEVTGLACAFP